MRRLALATVIIGVLAACDSGREPSSPSAETPLSAPFRTRSDQSLAEVTGLNAADRVFFGFDSSALEASGTAVLQRQADWMQGHPKVLFMLAGHADERGTREYNLALGSQRAATVRDYLVALGVAPGRFKLTSYGKERPAVVGSTQAAWSLNRRVETLIDE
ncbi:MAG: OmpA family protein [Proteobacteria bacterium]|nr:OmpA family protein [Pseudomonadota bacterium]